MKKLWLWKNFVDGKPEYWAFDNPYPCQPGGGDPLTLGEPCGYAIVKESTQGRFDVSEAEVIAAIKRASAPSEKTTMSSDVKYYDLRAAVLALYYSAYWHPDRPVDEAALWTAVRDAAGIAHGKTAEKLGSDRTADAAEIAKADYRAMGGGYSEGGA